MTPEEIEKNIEFILHHQANSEVRQEKLQEQVAVLAGQNMETSAQIGALSQQMAIRDERVSANLENLSGKIENLSDGIEGLKDICRDLLNHAHQTDVRLTRLENPDR